MKEVAVLRSCVSLDISVPTELAILCKNAPLDFGGNVARTVESVVNL